ncbi:MAG: PsbP-like protein [Solirubrobacteraceae bacterium]|nr:PsbP-like protein [Solirubrobacteraceae bacterium]
MGSGALPDSMFARAIVNRKWMVAAGAAAILALVIGVQVGRSIIPSGEDSHNAPSAPPPARFSDQQVGITMNYPASWSRLQSRDPQVLLVAALSPATSLSLRVSKSQLKGVTARTLPVVKEFTDDLIAADKRAKLLSAPDPVSVGGLPGYRYRYTYTTQDGASGAHVHYLLFKHDLLIQLVFQALPATSLGSVEPTFDRIAGTLLSKG